jgi:MFS transporter, ACS family, tartrate transporter
MRGVAHAGQGELRFEQAIVIKIRNRCLPVLILGFIVSYLDRVNVGFAAITANKDMGLTATMFGVGAGLAFIGYSVFELPSNLALERFGARRWLARIMVSWGIISGCMVLVTGPWSFCVVRFLIGAAEAGFFPGVVLYLTYWFPKRYRARYVGMFALGIPLASVIGSPVSGMLLNMHGFLGLKGWQWLYLIEALPAVLLGIWIFFFFADRPRDARWLSVEQKDWLESELDRERAAQPQGSHIPALRMLLDSRVLVLALVFFLTGVPSYGISIWIPQIVKSAGLSFVETGFVAAIPFIFGCVAIVLVAKTSDRMKERTWHSAATAFVAFVGLAGGSMTSSPVLQLIAVCVSALGIYGQKGPWLAMISESFSSSTAAAGIALVSTLGSLSGFAAPYMIGVIIDSTGSYRIGLMALGVQSLAGAVILVIWAKGSGRHYYAKAET